MLTEAWFFLPKKFAPLPSLSKSTVFMIFKSQGEFLFYHKIFLSDLTSSGAASTKLSNKQRFFRFELFVIGSINLEILLCLMPYFQI